MASGAKLNFVPARQPEAIRSEARNYKIIRPKPPTKALTPSQPLADPSVSNNWDSSNVSSDLSTSSRDDSSEYDSTNDSTDSESSSDPESSDLSASNSEVDSESESASRTSLTSPSNDARPAESFMTKNAASNFYDINELPSDRGSRKPQRIYKSWHPSARAPVGLENQGVTCYQNAAIQALIHLPALGRYLLSVLKNEYPQVSANSVTVELANLFRKLTDRKRAVFPKGMIRRLDDINPMLDEWQQEDSHEYFMSLVGRLQEDSVPKGEKLRSSIIHDIFGGSVEQKVTCQRCKTVSTTQQDFYDLPISFSAGQSRGSYTLQRSIQDFFTPEPLEPHRDANGTETGGYHCEKCQALTPAVKQIAIAEAPEYLTVHIKRFKMDGSVSKKLKDTMDFPLELSLTDYEREDLAKSDCLQYKLVSVILHVGRTVSSGHYIALTRQPDNQWVMYDDETTQKIPESDVRNHPSAYILIYSRLLPKVGRRTMPASKTELTGSHSSASSAAAPSAAAASPQTTTLKSSHSKKAAQKIAKRLAKQDRKEKRKARARTDHHEKKVKSSATSRASSSTIDDIFGAKRRKRA